MPSFEGNVDAVKGGVIIGWARDAADSEHPVAVEVVHHSSILASAPARGWRRDLQIAGIGRGFHGFSLELLSVLGPGSHNVRVRVAGSDFFIGPDPITVNIQTDTTAFDRRANTEGRFCSMPFEKFVLKADGGVHVCCTSYVPAVIGNAYEQSYDEIWNSPVAQGIRASILDGTFKYCLNLCPEIQKGTLPLRTNAGRHQQAVDSGNVRLDYGPSYISLLQDQTCNLSCPSCRTDLIIADASERERLRAVVDRVIEPLLPGAHTLEVAGGEFLYSRHLRDVLARVDRVKHPNLRITAWTNGTLFNEKAWAQLKNAHGLFERILVSLDAARPRTFELVRRGGVWETVRRNLDFIAGLRRAGECDAFEILFVVQRDNFREMGEFVDLGKTLGCDAVRFHELLNFGTFAPREFEARNVIDPAHPLHDELAEVLTDPRLDDPIADLGTLTAFRAQLTTRRGAASI